MHRNTSYTFLRLSLYLSRTLLYMDLCGCIDIQATVAHFSVKLLSLTWG